MEPLIEVFIRDAEDGELKHKIISHSIDNAIEYMGAYERHHMENGKIKVANPDF